MNETEGGCVRASRTGPLPNNTAELVEALRRGIHNPRERLRARKGSQLAALLELAELMMEMTDAVGEALKGRAFYEPCRWTGELRLRHRDKPARRRMRCAGTTRKGQPCQAKAIPGRRWCKWHGGCATGPRTPEGKAAIAESNRRRAQLRRENGDKSETSPAG